MENDKYYSRVVGDAPLIGICLKYHSLFVERRKVLLQIKADYEKNKSPQEHDGSVMVDKNHSTKIYNVSSKCWEYAYIVIIFSHMYLESFIYDYAAFYKSDSVVKRKYERKSFLEKWKTIPYDFCGMKINEESEEYVLLKKLNDARRSVVHYKSCNIPTNDKTFEVLRVKDEKILETANDSIKTVFLILSKLKENDPYHPKFTFGDIEKFRQKNI